MKKLSLVSVMLVALPALASVPQGYYSDLNGKSGIALRDAVAATAAGHSVVDYGDDTWNAFLSTDVVYLSGDLQGRVAWRDMYSNMLVFTEQGHPGLNIEHSVPNSWWGGIKNDAYKDLFHLNPANSTANNQKSNWPLGVVSDVYWNNGVSTVGYPATGFGGSATKVFEPADQFKGDFARAYFYIFASYGAMTDAEGGIAWRADYNWMYDVSDPLALRPWAADLLLKWAAEDPVDQNEIDRNEAIYRIQKNRNPFVDYPQLAEYVFGAYTGQSFELKDETTAVAVNRPAAPELRGFEIVGLDTYAARWWNALTIEPTLPDAGADLQVSIDGKAWENVKGGSVKVDPAAYEGEQMYVRFRASWDNLGYTLYSPVTYLTLTARSPESSDLKDAVWRRAAGMEEDGKYIVVAPATGAVMSATLNKTFFDVAGYVTPEGDCISGVPEGTAVVTGVDLTEVSGGYGESICVAKIQVEDLEGNVMGLMAPTAAKKMSLDSDGVMATVTGCSDPDADGYMMTVVDFGGELGRLQYNSSSPRFLNYTSKQTPLALYRLEENDVPTSADFNIVISSIRVEGRNIVVPAGIEVYDIQGRVVCNTNLAPGIYIAGGRKLIVK